MLRRSAALPHYIRGVHKRSFQQSVSLSVVIGLIVTFTLATSTLLGIPSSAQAAVSCPSGTTLTTYNSENYCKVDVSSAATSFTVPSNGVSELFVILDGGHGQETFQPTVVGTTHVPGGAGAHIEANISVIGGQVFTLRYSTQGGSTGGGRCSPPTSNGMGGGWAALAANSGSNILVAGGGGGSGCGGSPYADVQGGAGGNAGLPAINNVAAAIPAMNGGTTTTATASKTGGTGATTSAGGTGYSTGVALLPSFVNTAGVGHISGGSPGGGGGGGYYGGGGGAAGTGWDLAGSGGGGGSSYNSGFTVTEASYSTASPATMSGSVQVLFQFAVPLTFDPQNSGSTSTSTFWPGGTVTLPAAPSKPGYNFNGWYTASTGGTLAGEAGDTYSPAGSNGVTLFAQWASANYSVTFDAQGGSSLPDGTYTYNSGMSLPAAPTKTGNTFSGWFSASSGGVALSEPYNPMSTAPFSLFAQWSPNSYIASFNCQGGSSTNSIPYVFGSSITLPAAPTLSGHTFRGWYNSNSGGSLLGIAGATYQPTSGTDQTIFAQWDVVPDPSNGSSGSQENRLASTGVELASLLILIASLISSGAALLILTRRKSNS